MDEQVLAFRDVIDDASKKKKPISFETAKAMLDVIESLLKHKEIKGHATPHGMVLMKDLSDKDLMSLIAHLSNESCLSLDNSEGYRAALYLRAINKVVTSRKIIPAEIDDFSINHGEVYFKEH